MCFPVFPIATHAATGCGSHRQTRKLRCFFRMATLFSKVTPKSCLRGLPACHRDQCSTYSIDVVSKCSYGHSSCFSWSSVLHALKDAFFPCSSLSLLLFPDSFPSLWRQQQSSRRRQQQASSSSVSQAAAKQTAAGTQQAGTRG